MEEKDFCNPMYFIMVLIIELVKLIVEAGLKITRVPKVIVPPTTSIYKFAKRLESIIGGRSPQTIYTSSKECRIVDNSHPDTGCIMVHAHIHMANPLIDFDLENSLDLIQAVCEEPSHPRSKPVIATVRGIGGGKTRCFEEIRRSLLIDDEVLPIAITFNCNSEINLSLERWYEGDNESLNFALSIIARMFYAIYGLAFGSFIELLKLMKTHIPLVDLSGLDGAILIRTAITVIVEIFSEKYRLINKFVLLIDETIRYQNIFKSEDDICGCLRNGVLSELISVNGNIISTALLISSLDISPLGITISGRDYLPLVLPAKLDVVSIVDSWWRRSNNNETEYHTFLLTAAVINSLPRTVEFSAQFMIKWGDKPVDSSFVNAFYSFVVKRIKRCYSSQFPSLKLLHACVFQIPILIDNEVMAEIRTSTITNSIRVFSTEKTYIIPEMSLIMLEAAAENGPMEANMEDIILLIREMTQNIFKELADSAGNSSYQSGFILETMVRDCLRLHLGLAVAQCEKSSSRQTTLAELMGVKNSLLKYLDPYYENILRTPLNLRRQPDLVHVMHESSMRGNSMAFLQEFDSIVVTEDKPLHIIRSAANDKWDVAIKMHLHDGTSFYIITDEKSKDEVFEQNSKSKRSNKKQYHEFENDFPVLNFLYVYYTTHEGYSRVKDRCVVMCRDDTLNFMGFFAELYCVARRIVTR